MAPILLRAVNTADCGFNRAALRPAYPIKRPRARREHRHPKASKPGKSLPLDPLENRIGGRAKTQRIFANNRAERNFSRFFRFQAV